MLGSLPGYSQSPAPTTATTTWTRTTIKAPICLAPPKIDGVLDDPCWKSAYHVTEFYRPSSPIVEQTEAWICCDSTHLYVAFLCHDSHPELIRATETQRDGNITPDDQIAVGVDSQNTQANYSQFNVSARGTQTESLEGGTAGNTTWAGDWYVATKRGKEGWGPARSPFPSPCCAFPRARMHLDC